MLSGERQPDKESLAGLEESQRAPVQVSSNPTSMRGASGSERARHQKATTLRPAVHQQRISSPQDGPLL